jgi:hypothetical protein
MSIPLFFPASTIFFAKVVFPALVEPINSMCIWFTLSQIPVPENQDRYR